jgi:hypothetical protein
MRLRQSERKIITTSADEKQGFSTNIPLKGIDPDKSHTSLPYGRAATYIAQTYSMFPGRLLSCKIIAMSDYRHI